MPNELYRNRMLNDIDYAVREAKSAALLAHNGLVGRVRELMVSRLLAPMLPAGFEVGTGKITNAVGALSQETDLVIYNRSILPPVFYYLGGGQYLNKDATGIPANVSRQLSHDISFHFFC